MGFIEDSHPLESDRLNIMWLINHVEHKSLEFLIVELRNSPNSASCLNGLVFFEKRILDTFPVNEGHWIFHLKKRSNAVTIEPNGEFPLKSS